MEFSFAGNSDIHNLARWQREVPGGGALLLDPATGQALSPHVPPEWLRDDDRLNSGYQFLAQNSNRLDVKIFYTKHTRPDDLGDDWFERQVAECDVFAFEAAGWRRDQHAAVLGGLALGIFKPRNQLDAFAFRRLRAVPPGKPSFSCDIEATDRPIDQLLLSLGSQWHPESYRGSNSSQAMLDRSKWSIIHFLFRDWYMVGKLGYELEQLGIISKHDTLRIFMHAGKMHQDITRKMRLFGLAPKSHRTPDKADDKPVYDLIGRIAGSSIYPIPS